MNCCDSNSVQYAPRMRQHTLHVPLGCILGRRLLVGLPSLLERSCCLSLPQTFEEREALNAAIVRSINEAADAWGLQCMRYEIKDITPPSGIVQVRVSTAWPHSDTAEVMRGRFNILSSD